MIHVKVNTAVKKAGLYLLVGAVGVIFGILLIELFLKFFLLQETYSRVLKSQKGCSQNGTATPIAFKPNCDYIITTADFKQNIHINGQGFRGKEIEKENGGVFRIFMSGDSFVFGHGVDEENTVEKYLQDDLNKMNIFGGKRVVVVNLGSIGGNSPDMELLAVREFQKLGYKADMLIAGMFVYNDVSDMDSSVWIGTSDYDLPKRIESRLYEVTPDGYFANKNSNLANLYKNKFLRESNLAVFFQKNWPGFWAKVKNKLGAKPYVGGMSDSSDDSYFPVAYEDCVFGNSLCHRRFLHIFDDLVRVYSAGKKMFPHFLTVLEPGDFQIYSDAGAKYPSYSDNYKNAYKIEDPQPQKRMRSMLQEKGINFLDLLGAFRKNAEPRTYYPVDGHWNNVGTKLAASEIANWIAQNVKD